MKLQVQQKSIRLSRTIQSFLLRGVLAPNLCLLTLLHSSPSDSPLSFQISSTCHVLLMPAVWPYFCITTRKVSVTQQRHHPCFGRAAKFVSWTRTRTFNVLQRSINLAGKGLKTHLAICVKLTVFLLDDDYSQM